MKFSQAFKTGVGAYLGVFFVQLLLGVALLAGVFILAYLTAG